MKKKYFRDLKDHPDFFIIDIQDLSIKNELKTMEYPFFSLSKSKDFKTREWELKDGSTLKVAPNAEYGLATIHDKDVWLYFLSLAVHEYNKTGEVPRKIYFHNYDCLTTIKRSTGGKAYNKLKDSIERLTGTVVTTNIGSTNRKFTTYPLIGQSEIIENTKGNSVGGYIYIPDWLIEQVIKKQIKTINPDYFLLKRPIDKRLYEIASKHVGNGISWPFSLKELKLKSGSLSSLREFRRMVKESAENALFPDYIIEYDREKDIVKFINKNPAKSIKRSHVNRDELPVVSEEVKNKVRRLAKKTENIHLEGLNDPAKASFYKWIEFWKLTGRRNISDVEKDYLIFSANFLKEYDGGM